MLNRIIADNRHKKDNDRSATAQILRNHLGTSQMKEMLIAQGTRGSRMAQKKMYAAHADRTNSGNDRSAPVQNLSNSLIQSDDSPNNLLLF